MQTCPITDETKSRTASIYGFETRDVTELRDRRSQDCLKF